MNVLRGPPLGDDVIYLRGFVILYDVLMIPPGHTNFSDTLVTLWGSQVITKRYPRYKSLTPSDASVTFHFHK